LGRFVGVLLTGFGVGVNEKGPTMIPVGFGVSFTTIGLNPMGVLVGPGMLRNRCGMGFVEGIGIFRMLGLQGLLFSSSRFSWLIAPGRRTG
jgi:hypothetical protein